MGVKLDRSLVAVVRSAGNSSLLQGQGCLFQLAFGKLKWDGNKFPGLGRQRKQVQDQDSGGRKLTPRDPAPDPVSSSQSLLREEPKMLLLRASTPFAYAKVDKVDAEEARHLRAQFLIHKVLEEKSPRPSALARARPRIGVRLKKLRLAVRALRARACRALQRHLGNLRRLVGRGGVQGSP
ncbi:hypothetical protein Zm00014a_038062 [Zea mays]|uniref:Uncharacterized protein n=1 Tax=Zea mays TaxID=4577 RepID=A0A3L6DWN9_MAIZE|nr:hypothetical protein Zm00014a_038062 [Zea mays]